MKRDGSLKIKSKEIIFRAHDCENVIKTCVAFEAAATYSPIATLRTGIF